MAKDPKKWAKFEPGMLHGWHKDLSDTKRRKILCDAVDKESYATIIRRLNQLANVTKDKETKVTAKKDMEYLHKKYRE